MSAVRSHVRRTKSGKLVRVTAYKRGGGFGSGGLRSSAHARELAQEIARSRQMSARMFGHSSR